QGLRAVGGREAAGGPARRASLVEANRWQIPRVVPRGRAVLGNEHNPCLPIEIVRIGRRAFGRPCIPTEAHCVGTPRPLGAAGSIALRSTKALAVPASYFGPGQAFLINEVLVLRKIGDSE